ncbi:MAG: anti-sigma factor [Terriglobia bacterium]|nr:anti-sigma factor [Terriglobia bacterium]
MTPDLHPELDDLIFYSMGSPDAPEAAAVMDRVRAHLQQCAACRSQVEDIQADMIALSVPQTPRPAEAKERLFQAAGIYPPVNTGRLASIKTFPKPVSDASRGAATTRARRPNPGLIWGGWVAAVVLLFYAVHVREANREMRHGLQMETPELHRSNAAAVRARDLLDLLTSPHARRVTLVSAHAQPEPEGDAVYLKERGSLVFTASNLAALPANKTYELWLIPANGAAPIPAGTFEPDAHGMASVLLPHLPAGIEVKAFGVTLENAGGSATPTLPILLAGG